MVTRRVLRRLIVAQHGETLWTLEPGSLIAVDKDGLGKTFVTVVYAGCSLRAYSREINECTESVARPKAI
jgi:hypothetical protein